MIPALLEKAVANGGWSEDQTVSGRLGTWIVLRHGELLAEIFRDRWRHTTARVFRSNRLTAVLHTQSDIANYLENTS